MNNHSYFCFIQQDYNLLKIMYRVIDYLVVNSLKKDKPKYKQIIDAAVIVIAENGYHQSQVSKIAKQAGVADGTIYLYFKNKEDILISVFRRKNGSIRRKFKANN